MMKIKYLKILLVLISTTVFSQKLKLENGLYAEIQTTKGNIIVQLEFNKTPMTVANFVSLAEGENNHVAEKYKGKPFYDGLIFHRVIPNFMIQGGDPLGTGSGDPGYKFKDEFDDTLLHDTAGILSMANSGPMTNGSQFFITHKKTPWLNNKHTIFGHVVNGQDVVNAIKKEDIINKIKIIRKGKEAKKYKAAKTFDNAFIQMEKDIKDKKEKELALIKTILENESKAEVLDSGLKMYTVEAGLGEKPKKGETVKIHYTGYLRNGDMFDSSLKRGQPFKTAIGVGRVIKGWDEGVQQLRVGTKAILYIPSKLAYGKRGAGSVIPPNSDIIFEVELLEIIK